MSCELAWLINFHCGVHQRRDSLEVYFMVRVLTPLTSLNGYSKVVVSPALMGCCQRSFNWQSTAFVMRGLWVRLPPRVPYLMRVYANWQSGNVQTIVIVCEFDSHHPYQFYLKWYFLQWIHRPFESIILATLFWNSLLQWLQFQNILTFPFLHV